MITEYPLYHQPAIAGMIEGHVRTTNAYLRIPPEQWTLTLTDTSEAGDLVISIADDESGQSWSLTVAISGAVEATSLDEIKAAWEADPKFNDLFSISENGALVATLVARHTERSYTITTTPPGSMSVTPAKTVVSSQTGVELGLLVARVSGAARRYVGLSDSVLLASSILGATKRTDGNHFHEIPDATADTTRPGYHHPIAQEGVIWLQCEETLVPGDLVFVRRSLTSGSGKIGAVRKTADGSVYSAVLTFVADKTLYGIEFTYMGTRYSILHSPTDGTTTAAEAAADFKATFDLQGIVGVTLTDNTDGTATMAFADGTSATLFKVIATSGDTPAVGITVGGVVGPDVDALDVSSYVTVLDPTLGSPSESNPGLVRCRVHFTS